MKRVFKYYPEDFGALTVNVLHMDLDFDTYEDHTKVHSKFKAKTLQPINELALDAKNLEILSVKGADSYEYKGNKLVVKFDKQIPANTEFVVETETICRPTKNILEGLYYDETPKGYPLQQITQCQQWGFQRIVPCIDDMTAKCTYTTTIRADSRYTNLITNGDISGERHSVGNGRDEIRYENTITPMAPYLFFLGVGTYAIFTKEVEYPEGDTFQLELLVPPGSDKIIAEKALDVLHDCVIWIYLFTGPDRYKNMKQSKELWDLIIKRNHLKEKGNSEELEKIRAEIKEKANLHFGYKYTGTVYREIGMQNSNFGGMENVGNTTIATNRIMPFPEMSDAAFEYMIRVKVHEYYHNLNGSEVTGRSPFELWLNEAVTVHIEKQYHSFLFGEDYSRLSTVLYLLSPHGIFREDESVASMPIEPDGFNNPDELITGVTYVKAPEFVRMIETLIGKEAFVKGLDLYHTRFKHGNATREDWLKAMSEVSGHDFTKMAQVWLKQKEFPRVHVDTKYESRKYTVALKQQGDWEFPFSVVLVDKDGKDFAEKMIKVENPEEEIVFEDVDEPGFVSLNRGYLFYGKVFHETDQLYLQVEKDSDLINRYLAYYYIADREKMKLLKNGQLDERFIDLYFSLLSDKKLMAKAGGQMLALFENVEDDAYAHRYQALHDVKKKIVKAIALKYKQGLLGIYKDYSKKENKDNYTEQEVNNIKRRQVKNIALSILAELDTEDIHSMIKNQFLHPECASDKNTAFGLYLDSSAEDKIMLLDDYEKEAKKNLVSWETFLAVVANNDSDDALDIIKRVEKSDAFRIEQANDQRALYARFAMNRKKSLLTEEGRDFLKETMIKLAPINEYNCLHILEVFGNIDKMEEKHHAVLVKVLMDVLSALDEEKMPSVCNNIKRILKGSPKAVKAFEEK